MKQKITFLILLGIGSYLFSQELYDYDDDLKFAQVEYVQLTERSDGFWTFDVSILHGDSGWNHYADLWIVVDTVTETILGSRILAHPHVSEQPFTRSLSGVRIEEDRRFIEVRAKCNVHDYKGKRVIIDLNMAKSKDYEIIYYN